MVGAEVCAGFKLLLARFSGTRITSPCTVHAHKEATLFQSHVASVAIASHQATARPFWPLSQLGALHRSEASVCPRRLTRRGGVQKALIRRGLRWKLIYDPKFESSRTCAKRGLGILAEPDKTSLKPIFHEIQKSVASIT